MMGNKKVTQWPVDEREEWASWSNEWRTAFEGYVDDTLDKLKAEVDALKAKAHFFPQGYHDVDEFYKEEAPAQPAPTGLREYAELAALRELEGAVRRNMERYGVWYEQNTQAALRAIDKARGQQ